MSVSEPEPLFVTDDDLARRLALVENDLADFEARLPTLRREIASLRRALATGESPVSAEAASASR